MRVLGDRPFARVGTALLGLAVLVAAVPLPDPVLAVVTPVANRWAVLLLAVTAGLVGVGAVSHRAGDARAEPAGPRPEPPDGEASDTTGPRLGEAVDDALDRLGDGRSRSRYERADDRQTVRRAVSAAAMRYLTESEGLSTREAADRLRKGTWADRPRAAAFLAGRSTTVLPLSTRIRDWLSGRGFERQARAAVAELGALTDTDVEWGEP